METKELDPDAVRECFALLRRPPDIQLLRRYHAARIQRKADAQPLTAQQERWVEVNLTCNRDWQSALASIRGSAPAMTLWSSPALKLIAAAALIVLAPVWISTILYSGDLSRADVQTIYAEAEEVVRGSSQSLGVRQDGLDAFPSPSLSTLRDLQSPDVGAEHLSRLRSDLSKRYEASTNRIERAEMAYVLAEISSLLHDATLAETWRTRCEVEEVFNCASRNGPAGKRLKNEAQD